MFVLEMRTARLLFNGHNRGKSSSSDPHQPISYDMNQIQTEAHPVIHRAHRREP